MKTPDSNWSRTGTPIVTLAITCIWRYRQLWKNTVLLYSQYYTQCLQRNHMPDCEVRLWNWQFSFSYSTDTTFHGLIIILELREIRENRSKRGKVFPLNGEKILRKQNEGTWILKLKDYGLKSLVQQTLSGAKYNY